jgi:hypothetical protein
MTRVRPLVLRCAGRCSCTPDLACACDGVLRCARIHFGADHGQLGLRTMCRDAVCILYGISYMRSNGSAINDGSGHETERHA